MTDHTARVREILNSQASGCLTCVGRHNTSFWDPPSYHEPDPNAPCETCDEQHLDHAFEDALRAVEAEARKVGFEDAQEQAAQVANAIELEEREYQSKLFGTEGEKLASLAAHTAKKIATAIRAMKP